MSWDFWSPLFAISPIWAAYKEAKTRFVLDFDFIKIIEANKKVIIKFWPNSVVGHRWVKSWCNERTKSLKSGSAWSILADVLTHTHKHFSFYSIVSLTGAESNFAMFCLQYYRVKLRIVLHSVLQSLTLRCPAIQYYRVLRVGLHDVLAVVIQSLTPRCPAYRSTESNSAMSGLQIYRV